MELPRILRRNPNIQGKGINALFVAWFVVTVLAQHPDRVYDKVRSLDVSIGNAAIPNWRFFAPKPAVEDVHFLYRFLSDDQEKKTSWRALHTISDRKIRQMFWFPERRHEKALFDIANTLMTTSPTGPEPLVKARLSAISLINDAVRRHDSPPDSFPFHQVLMVRFAGHQSDSRPQYDMIFDPVRWHEDTH
ncbi:hypothetical protein [Glutamicibacter ardleyensis]|uniref:hypothetical protein n=1 Tax=Glutamicibacter ardleyensis TaxID=225894 RepID=UPI003FD31D6B